MPLREYVFAQMNEIERIFGVCNDDTLRKFVERGLSEKFREEHGSEYAVNPLIMECREKAKLI